MRFNDDAILENAIKNFEKIIKTPSSQEKKFKVSFELLYKLNDLNKIDEMGDLYKWKNKDDVILSLDERLEMVEFKIVED